MKLIMSGPRPRHELGLQYSSVARAAGRFCWSNGSSRRDRCGAAYIQCQTCTEAHTPIAWRRRGGRVETQARSFSRTIATVAIESAKTTLKTTKQAATDPEEEDSIGLESS